ncbi:hypothetical protein KIW84_071763 [Lathyrus oleraceus]|uniref:Uncharacterized protein n=1 Tax=Pisum sativum TaxID=3888 RepID=A0A9D4VJK2_PEA|nr:hypothetical protein KIW84_071763 [Pisum sativum]
MGKSSNGNPGRTFNFNHPNDNRLIRVDKRYSLKFTSHTTATTGNWRQRKRYRQPWREPLRKGPIFLVNHHICLKKKIIHCIVLAIEGTITPISFVSVVLSPYASHNVGRHLSATYNTSETKADIKLLPKLA